MNKTLSVSLIQWGILALGIASIILFFYNISYHHYESPVSSSTVANEAELLDKTKVVSRLSFPIPDRPTNTFLVDQSEKEPLNLTLPPDKTTAEERTRSFRKPPEGTLSKEGSLTFEKPSRPITSSEKSAIVKIAPEPAASKAMLHIAKQTSKPNTHIEKVVPSDDEVSLENRVFSYPYSISLGSFKTLVNARKAISIFQERGLAPYWVKVDLGAKGVWFRVFAGYFRTREDANAFIKDNRIVGGESRHTRYANLIGTYSSKKRLEEMRLRLLDLGYYPYVIEGIYGESFLFMGAFYQRARAEKHAAELASKGFQSQVVNR